MQQDCPAPKVSVGLPVYNGERYVAEAIESILAQTYKNFELIISDNASTDRTEEICRRYAERDTRVRYYRQSVNTGAAANFNRVFELAEGSKYFKWAAHDDMLAPPFLEKCVVTLEAIPDAVLCYPWVQEIDESGDGLAILQSRIVGADRPRASDRFAAAVFKVYSCEEIFGIIRAPALRCTTMHRNYKGEDKTLITELALCGRFLEIPEPLFLHRQHPDRYVIRTRRSRVKGYASNIDEVLTWYDPRNTGVKVLRLGLWIRYFSYFRMVRHHVPQAAERLRCYAHLLRWLGVTQNGCRFLNSRRLLYELIEAIDPQLPVLLSSVKRFPWVRSTRAQALEQRSNDW